MIDQQRIENQELLHTLMPETVAKRYRDGEQIISEDHQDVCVVFAELVGFDDFASSLSSEEELAQLNTLMEPPGAFHATTTVKFTTDDPPHCVTSWAVLRRSGSFTVDLPLEGPAAAQQAMSMFLGWRWYAARRRGLALDGDTTDPLAEPARLEGAIAAVAPILHVGADDRDTVLGQSRLERYGIGEIVQAGNVVPSEIRLIVAGKVRLAIETAGELIDVTMAEPVEFIGQGALTREATITTAIAVEVTTVVVAPLRTVDELVRKRPQLAREIGQSLEHRRQLVAEALATAGIVLAALTM